MQGHHFKTTDDWCVCDILAVYVFVDMFVISIGHWGIKHRGEITILTNSSTEILLLYSCLTCKTCWENRKLGGTISYSYFDGVFSLAYHFLKRKSRYSSANDYRDMGVP